MQYNNLNGVCKNCMRLQSPLNPTGLNGVYRCAYATVKKISVEDLRKELSNAGNKNKEKSENRIV